MVTTALSVNLSLITLQENETTKRLAACAALVAVPTLIAGVYGMNFKHMPELEWQFGYPLAIGLMLAIDAYLFYRFRKSGWLQQQPREAAAALRTSVTQNSPEKHDPMTVTEPARPAVVVPGPPGPPGPR